jgi:hypothetical protein
MTKEEILLMKAGRELNIRITEDVMGYKFIQDEIFGDMEICELLENEVKKPSLAGNYYGPLQHYSEDISAANLVTEKLKNYNPRVEFNHYTENWEANFGCGVVSAPDAPEAICKAALLTVWEER